jgi:hypothetical protein
MPVTTMKLKPSKTNTPNEPALPQRSDMVTLVSPSGERLHARIAEHENGQLLVALMFRAERPLDNGRLDELVLEFASDRGRVRLRGTVTPVDSELLRFTDLHPIKVVQEREYVRVQAARPVLVSSGSSQSAIQTYSVDLSGGGILLAGPGTLKIGERIQFRLTTTPGGTPIAGTATVVRTDSQGHRAIRFDEIDTGDQRRLVRFIFECQRAERRRGLERRHGR